MSSSWLLWRRAGETALSVIWSELLLLRMSITPRMCSCARGSSAAHAALLPSPSVSSSCHAVPRQLASEANWSIWWAPFPSKTRFVLGLYRNPVSLYLLYRRFADHGCFSPWSVVGLDGAKESPPADGQAHRRARKNHWSRRSRVGLASSLLNAILANRNSFNFESYMYMIKY